MKLIKLKKPISELIMKDQVTLSISKFKIFFKLIRHILLQISQNLLINV